MTKKKDDDKNIFLTNEEKWIHKTYIKIFFDDENIFFNRILNYRL